jgi:hypothetical protein
MVRRVGVAPRQTRQANKRLQERSSLVWQTHCVVQVERGHLRSVPEPGASVALHGPLTNGVISVSG